MATTLNTTDTVLTAADLSAIGSLMSALKGLEEDYDLTFETVEVRVCQARYSSGGAKAVLKRRRGRSRYYDPLSLTALRGR